ncbi:MAG: PAS domain S-box protein [Candidatus Eisenbacteria bacterium]
MPTVAARPSALSPQIRRWLLGPLTTAVAMATLVMLRGTSLELEFSSALLALVIAVSAAYGGVGPGLLAAGMGIAFEAWYLASPDAPFTYTSAALIRLIAISVLLPVLALVIGLLQRRAARVVQADAMAKASAEFREIFEQASDGIFVADATGRYIFANERALALSGYTLAELQQRRLADLVANEERGDLPRSIGIMRSGQIVTSTRTMLRKDGSRFTAEVAGREMSDGRIVGIVRDVSEQREAMGKLKSALSLVTATLESTADGILVVDSQGHIVSQNRRFAEMWRIPAAVLASRQDELALAHVLAQLVDPEAFLKQVRDLYGNNQLTSLDELRFRDGRVFERYSMPHRVDGVPVGRVWSFRDVTMARQQAEALRLGQQREQESQKFEALGRLAGGVAHDFNNMLTAILGESELALHGLPPESPDRRGYEHIREAALRSAKLTRKLLAFGHRQPLEPRGVDIVALVEGLDSLLQRIMGERVVLAIVRESDPPRVWADPAQLEQAIVNLVLNARDAIAEAGHVTVSIGMVDLTDADAVRRGARVAGRHGYVQITDDGHGFDDEVKRHLFEPFFTTKEAGRGTGLGLPSVYGAVEPVAGFIEVVSEKGKGSTFRLLLPEAPHEVEVPLAAPSITSGGSTSGRVLVVEDEHAVRSFVVALLRQQGFDVLAAGGAHEALELLRASPEPIEVLLTDVVMAAMSGPALADTLRSTRPNLGVVFMTGHPGDQYAHLSHDYPNAPLLAKPFGSAEFLRVLGAELERVRARSGRPSRV